ncbi:fasciclin domain-containing protein [Zhouia spongiae]|uniref:Fasciclin domain-containing protein n=1 Tax=Zhouia spongiae TaxID=2202721 RepID=A0ABY3YI12_9FLAO|nr:fasciclin domain-containing protein [Zhouia spongiae]UNY97300.1 fasciclin domain-containing protein [Zhouia spongiae]
MRNSILIIIALLVFCSCSGGDDYLVDGGISGQEVGMSTVDFFKSHEQLDTLALLIEKAGMVELFNSPDNTVFAPNNLSIKRYVDERLSELRLSDPMAEFTVNDIEMDTLTAYLGAYVFDDYLNRESMPKEQGAIFVASNGEERRVSLEPSGDYQDQLDSRPEYVFYTAQVGAEWDAWDSNVTNVDEKDDKSVARTSNLLSTNGVIHVLQGNGHMLFNYKGQ